ncbi:GMC family oxidoreductase [soil metagenome]
MRVIATEVLIIGSGAGGATTAVRLAEAGRTVTVVEEGPQVDPDAVEPFSLEEMVAKYRHGGGAGAFGQPPVAYTEGCCVGGSTEVNSGLWHRLPTELTEQWRSRYDIDEFDPTTLDREAGAIEQELGVSSLPGPAPRSSAILDDGATELGWRSTEFPRVFRYDERGRGVKQTMARTFLPRAVDAGAALLPNCRVTRLERSGGRVTGARAKLTRPDGTTEDVRLQADTTFVCGGAIHSPALLQRSGIWRSIGRGLKLHPTIKIAARFPFPTDHDDVAMHRITEFAPAFTIGGSASRRGHVAMALAETAAPFEEALADWRNVGVYYAAIRSEGSGAVVAVPGLASPIVTYRLTPNDLSKLAQGLVALGEVLLAAGAIELYPSVTGATIARSRRDLAGWWDAVTPKAANLMTVHLTSSIRMGERSRLAGTDSFGRVHGWDNLHVNDASLLPDAPGVNPQAGVMAIASRNAARFLAD